METLEGNKLINKYLGGKEIKSRHYAPNIVRNGGWYHQSWDWLMPAIEKFENGGGKYSILHHPGNFTCFVVYNSEQDRIFEFYSYHDLESDTTKLQRYWDGITRYLWWEEKRKTFPDFRWSSM